MAAGMAPVNDIPTPKTSFLAQLEPWVKASAVLVAAQYGLGLLVSNIYLMAFGIADFNAFRAKYIITGTWALLLSSQLHRAMLAMSSQSHKHFMERAATSLRPLSLTLQSLMTEAQKANISQNRACSSQATRRNFASCDRKANCRACSSPLQRKSGGFWRARFCTEVAHLTGYFFMRVASMERRFIRGTKP